MFLIVAQVDLSESLLLKATENSITPKRLENKDHPQLEPPKGDPRKWTCDQVYRFVSLIVGVETAEKFRFEEVDGLALSLIKCEHLVSILKMKLGPALKVIAAFNEVKKSANKQ
jgi:hypothetical protein